MKARDFLADKSPQAFEKVADRLLASPSFGERWASVWMDLARYADTVGYERDYNRVDQFWRTQLMVEKQQATKLPLRVPWSGFAEVIVHSSIQKLKSLPEYDAAKQGDDRAAAQIARALVRPEKIDMAIDYVIPIIQVEHGHYNAIPVCARRTFGQDHSSEALAGSLPA